jgi:hypothetical protein
MRNWDQQNYDLMQVQNAIYATLPVSPNFNFTLYYLPWCAVAATFDRPAAPLYSSYELRDLVFSGLLIENNANDVFHHQQVGWR